MRILFVGSFENPWSTHHPIVREFMEKGHKVIKFDFRKIAYDNISIKHTFYKDFLREKFEMFLTYRPYLPNRIRDLKYYLFGNWSMNRILLFFVKKYKFDIIFLAKAESVNYNLIKRLNKCSKTWFYFMDPLYISHEMRAHKYAKNATWSSASTRANSLLFNKKGARCYHITQGADIKLFNVQNAKDEKSIDVLFVGTKTDKRKRYVNYIEREGINIKCFGVGWKNNPIYLEELIEKYHDSKIILNFHKNDSGFSIRVFEVLATDSFLLSEYCSDLENSFNKGIHLDWFRNPRECVELIRTYLANESKRKQIAQTGGKLVRNSFAWRNIVDKILQIIESDT
ncbi:MAG: glycosyltransferase [Candidatus Lokiarchaeota archaeon]|nr:glycosyltransferase [Candidatus Lokiarchaeota archaeon]